MRALRLLIATLAVAAVLPDGRPVAGSAAEPATPPTDERLQQIRERRQALQSEVERLRGQEKSLLGDVERLELEVRLRGEELAESQAVLQKTNEKLDATVKRVRQLEASLQEVRPLLAARARALYKLGELSYLRMLLSVDRPSDIFRGYRFVTTLARRDNERIARFRADLQALTATRAELEERTRQALLQRAELDRVRRGLDADRRRKEKLLTEIVEQKETHALFLQELEEAESKLGQLLQGLSTAEVALPLGAFRGALPWPVDGRTRVPFGRRKHPRFNTYTIQNGIDIEAPLGAPVRAVHEGTVGFADRFQGYGLMVILDHGGKQHSLYAHLATLAVKTGQRVAAGDVLGTAGAGLDGPGIYFEIRAQGRPEDPAEWLKPAAADHGP